MDLAQVARELFESPSRGFAVGLWDGTILPAERDGVRGRVVLRTPRALDAMLPPVSERQLAETALDGDLDIEGDWIDVLSSAAQWEGPRLRISLARAIASAAVQRVLERARHRSFVPPLPSRLHSLARDRRAVRHHYDLSDAFYRLFLDRAMVYSSAYFVEGGETLEQAQQAKLELVCRKLALAPGERLLDVGCGWGALLTYAAAQYRVGALGITLSTNQLAEARRRVARMGAGSAGARVSVATAVYRTLPAAEEFDKIASIGMMEHVGRGRLGEYFAALYRLLRPGGLLLNQAIADTSPGHTTLPWASRRGGGFIARHIFPDSDLVPLGQVVAAAERAGFEVRDVESLREHYEETLASWLAHLEARFEEAEKLVGRRRARAYRLYLASSAAAFRLARISVFQLLLAKPSQTGQAEGVPRCRAAWYRDMHPASRELAPADTPAALLGSQRSRLPSARSSRGHPNEHRPRSRRTLGKRHGGEADPE
jgi:cyclopropane-fatty-acyl-phospholipid synthase